MVNKYILILLVLLISIVPVFAIPTTEPAVNITSNSAELQMSGISGSDPTWFEWGQKSGSLSWKTPNTTGLAYATIYGSPLLGNTIFYFRACDDTGCDVNEGTFTTDVITPQPTTTFGISYDNITSSQFDIEVLTRESISSYFWAVPSFGAIVWGLLFFGIYLGLWMRERDLVVPVILGLIAGSFILWGDAGLGLGVPVEFLGIAQGIIYAALAGILLTIIKRS